MKTNESLKCPHSHFKSDQIEEIDGELKETFLCLDCHRYFTKNPLENLLERLKKWNFDGAN
jgi:uncharacterized CHY-type Zn-finger protein